MHTSIGTVSTVHAGCVDVKQHEVCGVVLIGRKWMGSYQVYDVAVIVPTKWALGRRKL